VSQPIQYTFVIGFNGKFSLKEWPNDGPGSAIARDVLQSFLGLQPDVCRASEDQAEVPELNVAGPVVCSHHVVHPLDEGVWGDGVFFSLTPKLRKFGLRNLKIDASIGTLNSLSMVDGYAIIVVIIAIVIDGSDRFLVVLSHYLDSQSTPVLTRTVRSDKDKNLSKIVLIKTERLLRYVV
jgi:hypothetical protein